MRVLYVTGLCGPIEDLLRGKREDEITHGYQFLQPWYRLVQKGHRVDFIIASNFNAPPQIVVDWFGPENIYANVYDPYSEAPWYKRIVRRIKRFAKLVYFTDKALRENHYDFVYCKAFYEGLAGNLVANFHGVPSGMRSMGTMLFQDLVRYGPWLTAVRHPAEYMVFKLKKSFFLMTDDGTRGDFVYSKWKPRKKKYEYLFWKTGLEMKALKDLNTSLELPEHPYLFFAARFEGWKRHDRVLELLVLIHRAGYPLHLYLAGSSLFEGYFNQVKETIRQLGLEDYVHFLGTIKQDDLKNFSYHAVANPLMYDVSNLGNVFFEEFSVGAIVLGLNDGSLDEYVKHGENGFLIEDEEHGAMVVKQILENEFDIADVRHNAIACAKEKFLTSDVRFGKEVEVIERAAAGQPIYSIFDI